LIRILLKLNGLSDLKKYVDIEAVACVHNLQYRFSTVLTNIVDL